MARTGQDRVPLIDLNEHAGLLTGHGVGGLVATAGPLAAHFPPVIRALPVSATLAVNEAMAARLRRGQPVLPLGFGEAGLPVHPVLRAALATSATCNSYGPVAGLPALRAAAAGYWQRRGLPTGPGSVVGGPGSKALLFALMLAIGGDVAIPRPSWVSYAAQARVLGIRAHPVAVPPGEGGICDPAGLEAAISAAATWATRAQVGGAGLGTGVAGSATMTSRRGRADDHGVTPWLMTMTSSGTWAALTAVKMV